MNTLYKFFLLFGLMAAVSCQNERNLDEFKFLVGKWQGSRDGTTLQEIWSSSGSALSGQGIVFAGTDTLFHEKLSMEVRDGEIYYVATVPNNPGPVPFRLVASGKNSWTFENKEHDFPQNIQYTLFGSDSLQAVVSGNDNGKISKEEFHFKKID